MTRYILPLFIMLIAMGMYVSYISPTWSAISVAKARRNALASDLADAQKAKERLAQIKQQYAQFPPGADKALATILPSSVDSIHLIIEINNLAEKRGLLPKSVGVTSSLAPVDQNGVPLSALDRHTISFTVSAPYPVLRGFLRDLESSLALRDMQNITFSIADSNSVANVMNLDKDPNLVSHDYNISVVTYMYHS